MAADLLAQAEHDVNAKSILVTTDRKFGEDVILAVEEELKTLPTAEIASASWRDFGEVVLVDSLDEAISYSNKVAPEHLELNIQADEENTVYFLERLTNYGSLFIGENTAEVRSGTNETHRCRRRILYGRRPLQPACHRRTEA